MYRPKFNPPICQTLTSRIETRVGGLMGIGGSVCTTDIIFDRNQYYVGDQCAVKIICDNSKCNTPIKSFKLKLNRRIKAFGECITTLGDKS